MTKVSGFNYLTDKRTNFYKNRFTYLTIILFLIGVAILIISIVNEPKLLNPKGGIVALPKAVEAMEVPTPTQISESVLSWSGVASYYSEEGCLGCNANLTMANGKRFTNEGRTIAFNRLPLGSVVQVINTKNNMIVTAEVTDRGGFERLGRIADLSPKIRDSINCSDLCNVKIFVKTSEVY